MMEAEDKTSNEQLPLNIQYKTIRCRILPGFLHSENKGAIDWGWQSLIAYGCHTLVFVVDPKTVQVLQALNKHQNPVVKIKWAKENYYHDLSNPYYPKLASADSSGHIVVWDVIYSKSMSSFSDGQNKSVLDMEWLSFWNNCNDFLAVLHPSYSFIIWNTTNGNKLWKKTYTESLLCFSFDPFEPTNVAFLAQDSILFIDDFTLNKTPSSNGRKFYISNPSSVSSVGSSSSSGGMGTLDEKLWTTEKLRRRVQFLVKAESKSGNRHDETLTSTNCLGLMYHRTRRHQLLLVYPKEILIIDLEINQTIGIISMERNGSPFMQIYPCQQEDAFFILHENGSVSLRIRKKPHSFVSNSQSCVNGRIGSVEIQDDVSVESDLDMNYEIICQSDSLRLTKTSQLMGLACCPVTERKVVLILSDGRLLFLNLMMTSKTIPPDCGINIVSNYYSKNNLSYPKMESVPQPITCLFDMLHCFGARGQTVSTEKGDSEGASSTFKFLLNGLFIASAPPPVVIRMCPPLTTRNWSNYNPWLAVGTVQGTIQIVCMASGTIQKELSIHTCPVRGIEWISLHAFITFAYPILGNSGGVIRNELILTDITTGKQKILRAERNEESAIEMVKVSCHKQYFIVAFKDDPFELWDLQRLILLRTMPKKFPIVTALEWSPVCSIKKKFGSVEKGSVEKFSDITPISETSSILSEKSYHSSQQLEERILAKENFVFTDPDGQLYNFSVEGNIIKDGFKIPSDGSVGSITCIAWRLDQIVMGDVDGNLTQWELKTNSSVVIPTHRGWIKKIRFAPGRGNMKILILYNNGVEIWDFREMEKISSIKSPSDMPKIYDIDWAASDTPILACVDGCIYLMDLKLKHCTSASYRYHLNEPVFLPYLSTTEAALNFRTFLQHQNWRAKYSLEFSEKDGIREEDVSALQNYITSIDSDIAEYLPRCPFGTAQRCLLTARLFGDESELHFWIIALHYLRANYQEDHQTKGNADYQSIFENKKVEKVTSTRLGDPLESSYDILCDLSTFRKRQLERLSLHDSKRATYEQTKKCAESLIVLGQTDRAVQILLETDAINEHYYTDNLRACLVSSVCSSGAAQSTIKLVATNLIANGCISEGVQLLCLINKSADACRYLQSYGQWNKAAWLAKATLNYTDCLDVMRRWVDHLVSTQVNQKQKAIHVLLSMAQFQKVIELLMSMKAVERAAMFIHSCEEFGILKKYQISNSLVEAVFLEYARYLFCLGNTPAAYYYCSLVGLRGEQLRKEMEILSEDSRK